MVCIDNLIEHIQGLFEAAAEMWKGCAWPTEFGTEKLNLQGMTSGQAQLISRATCGAEQKAWREAAEWLATIEADASRAMQEAQLALDLASRGKLVEARTHSQRAVDIETAYRFPSVWVPLRDALLTANRKCELEI